MRSTIPLVLAVVLQIPIAAQTPAPAPQVPPAAPPAAPRPAAPRPATTTRPAGVSIQVTDQVGAPLGNTQVTVTGPVAREGTTLPDGSLRLANLRAGTYRMRFTREGSITLERDLTIRAGETFQVDATLSPAPVVPKVEPPKPAPEPATNKLAPPGESKVTPVPLFLEKNFIGGREGKKESALGCSATGAASLLQLREALPPHTHDDGDEWIYVVAGEGNLRLGNADQRLQAGTFGLVPYSTSHAITPQGRNPLIVISVMSGPRCNQ